MQGPRIKLVFVIRYIMAAVNSHLLTRLALLLFYFISLEVNITKNSLSLGKYELLCP